MKGLLSKAYAKERAGQINHYKNNPSITPGNPYPFEGKMNPFTALLKQREYLTDSTKSCKGNALPKHDRTGAIQNILPSGTTLPMQQQSIT
jgi:gamma-glutamyltranspeptidase/glutathione hydrolase